MIYGKYLISKFICVGDFDDMNYDFSSVSRNYTLGKKQETRKEKQLSLSHAAKNTKWNL